MASLYELAGELKEAQAALEEAEEQDINSKLAQDLIAEWLSNVERDVDAKLDGMSRWIANARSRQAAYQAEIDILKAKLQAEENLEESLRKHIRDFLKATGRKNFKGIRSISVLAGRVSLQVDEDQILSWPAEMFEAALKQGAVEEVVRLKSKTALKALPGWEKLPGVKEVTGEDSIRIG